MKKTYICPGMDVIELKKQTLLAGSVPMLKSDTVITDEGEILAPEQSEYFLFDF